MLADSVVNAGYYRGILRPPVRDIMMRFVLLAILLLSLGTATHAADRPNILFIFTDDHAAHAMSCYGSKINTTPNLDRIASEGMRFDRCYVTNSICGPSRAVILTGKYSHLNGFRTNNDTFDGSQLTFPKLLGKQGYQTAVIGKWHLVSEPQGFDHWDILVGQGTYYNPVMIRNGERTRNEGYCTEIVTNHALEWLDRRDKDKPFVLMFQQKAPHREWTPGPKQYGLYKDVTIPEPDNLFDDYATRGTAAHEQDMTIEKTLTDFDLKFTPAKNMTPAQLEQWHAAYDEENAAFKSANPQGKDLVRWKYQRYIKDYLRCVAGVDDSVGRMLKYLDDHDLARNTVVIYSSDQGFYLGDHGWFDKRFMYEESYRMPLLVRWPGQVRPGSVNTDLVSNIDYAPTFLGLCGVEAPKDLQGHSLVPLLRGETPADWRKTHYYHYYEFFNDKPAPHMVRRHYGVRGERYKLIYFYTLDEWELYDLEADPHEMKNVYGDPALAEVTAHLKTELERLRKELQVPVDADAEERNPPILKRRKQN